MQTQSDFYSRSAIYNAGMLRPVAAPPPRATGRQHDTQLAYLRKSAQAMAVALTTVFGVPVQAVAASESAHMIRPAHRRNRISAPRHLHGDVVNHKRVHMQPRQVLIFRPVVRPVRMTPRPYQEEPEEE